MEPRVEIEVIGIFKIGDIMAEEWQVVFKVKGLVAPEEGVLIDDKIIVKGVPPSDDAYVYFKAKIHSEEEKDSFREDSENTLKDILKVYGLITTHYARLPSSRVTIMSKVSSGEPFGSMKRTPEGGLYAFFGDEKRRENIPLIKRTIAKYQSVKQIFEDDAKLFLRNAIDYFYHALNNIRPEERLIDLMIAMESLFSRQPQELRLRISLRAAFLLSIGKKNKRSDIFKRIYDLYAIRSKIVHGIQKVDLPGQEFLSFINDVSEAINVFFYIRKGKDEFLTLLDESVYDIKKRRELEELVLGALPDE